MIGKTRKCCVVCYNSKGKSVCFVICIGGGVKKMLMVARERANG